MSKQRTAFTLVELLVVIAIIGVMVGLLLPAVQQAREAARRMQCLNNLKQIGLAMQNFHAAHNCFPSSVSGNGAAHYWGAQLLPYLEQNPLADIYDYSVRFNDIKNREAVQYPLSFMLCPSTPGSPVPHPKFKVATSSSPEAWGALGSDYAGSSGPLSSLWNEPAVISTPKPSDIAGLFNGSVKPGEKGRRIGDLLDGTSNTVGFVESAARPQVWQRRKLVTGSGLLESAAKEYVSVCSWAEGNLFAVRGFKFDDTQAAEIDQIRYPGPQMINGSNYYGIYAFHPGGANVGLMDGSTRFLSESTSADIVASYLTIAGNEVTPSF
jgi:prepilin-type N-terminal cleavage/methylation domain-containing protein